MPSAIRWRIYMLVLALVLADQLSKAWVQANFVLGERLNLLPMLDFTLVYNEGAAWSILSDAGGWQRWFLSIVSAVVSLVLVVWIHRLRTEQRLLLAALTLILAGALGNLVDRLQLGKVVDFILVYYQDWYFPAFNVADSLITVGAVLMIADMFLNPEQPAASSGKGEALE